MSVQEQIVSAEREADRLALAAAREEVARLRAGIEGLADRLVTVDGPHPSHDHLCPDDAADRIRALLAGDL